MLKQVHCRSTQLRDMRVLYPVLCMIIGEFVLQVMLLLRTAEFKPFCVFVKPPPLKELRTSRLTVQQKGKPASVKSSMRTFKVA